MKISPRLKAIAELISEPILYDVGCDHALLDIYMAKNYNTTCIAIDISKNALNSANKNIVKYNMGFKIKTIVNNGLDNITLEENSCVVIAGMGTRNILNIIKDKNIYHLIIQSNNDLDILRKSITKKGYVLDNEIIIKEGHIYNCIISFTKGYKKYTDFEYKVGPILLKNKTDINKQYFMYLINVHKNINKKLGIKHIFKKIKNNYFIYRLKKEL